VFPGAIEIQRFLVRGPGAIKKRDQAMMKNIEESRDSSVAMIELAFVSVLRQVRRQGSIWPEQAKEMNKHLRNFSGGGLPDGLDARRCKDKKWVLAKSHGIFRQSEGMAYPGHIAPRGLEQAHRPEKSKPYGSLLSFSIREFGVCPSVAAIAGSPRVVAFELPSR